MLSDINRMQIQKRLE